MPTRTRYSQGTPCWVDLQTTDAARAKEFYSALFGWTFTVGDVGEGNYWLAQHQNEIVAGIAQHPVTEGMPNYWANNIAVTSVAQSAPKIEPAGGKILFGPDRAEDMGEFVMFTDPTGATASFWQETGFIGAQRVNEPGAFVWSELHSSDPEKSAQFYRETLGIQINSAPAGELDQYFTFEVDGGSVAGLLQNPMPGVPDSWVTYFCVASVPEAAQKAAEVGGTVLVDAFEVSGVGTMSSIQDPTGATFMIMDMAE